MARQTSANSRIFWRISAGLAVLVILACAVVWLIHASNSQTVSSQGNLKVVAAENFWGNIASQLGSNHVQVTSIITDPTADPHLYESNAQNASAIASADVVIVNGLGYDDFMNRLLGTSKNNERQVLTAAQILQVSGEEANPHLWYDIPRVSQVAAKIAASFEAKDPANKVDYQKNLQRFNVSLQPVLDTIAKIKQQYRGAPVAYTERVPGYLLAAAGLDVKTPVGFAQSIEDGSNPSPADTLAMDNLMTYKEVRLLLYNAQATSPVTQRVRNLALAAGVPVIGVTETLPTAEKSYQTWQQDQLNKILKALEAN